MVLFDINIICRDGYLKRTTFKRAHTPCPPFRKSSLFISLAGWHVDTLLKRFSSAIKHLPKSKFDSGIHLVKNPNHLKGSLLKKGRLRIRSTCCMQMYKHKMERSTTRVVRKCTKWLIKRAIICGYKAVTV